MEKLFHNILHQPVYFPSFLSEQGKSILEGLLNRDPGQRLGCGKDDGEEIIRHPFFAGIDFDKLLNKTYQPPFKPKVVWLSFSLYSFWRFSFSSFLLLSFRVPWLRLSETLGGWVGH